MTNGHSKPRPGDACQCGQCTGRLSVYVTRINFAAGVRIRYLRCQVCGMAPEGNKWILPLEYAPARAKR